MSDDLPTGRRIEPEMMVGISAVVIGICALGVSLYETGLMRTEQRAAVMPMIELTRSYNLNPDTVNRPNWRLYLHAENVGIGPARVMHFDVTVDGKSQPTWEAVMQALLREPAEINYGQSTIGGRTVPADRKIRMFDLNNVEILPVILAEFDRLDMEACYCSIFDECWTTRYSELGSNYPVDSCPVDSMAFQE